MKQFLYLLFIGLLNVTFSQTNEKHVSTNKINGVKKIAQEFLESESIPGMAISISSNGEMIFSSGFGYSNLETKQPVISNSTQFRIASISKSLTAVGLAKLMDAGKLELDESIYIYIPDFPKKKYDFTVRQVSGHIAGVRHYNGNEFILNKKMSIVEGLDIFKDSPLKFQPGTQYSYSTYGWNLLSVVIQNASDTEFNKYMKEQIFDPLNMHNTTLDLSDQPMPNRTLFYRKTNAGDIVLGLEVSNEHKVAGGGFVSTSEDLIKFGNEIINPKMISKESIKEILKPQKLTNGESTNYGVGFGIDQSVNGTPKYSHSGGGIGTTSLLLMYPEEGVVISLLTNRSQLPIREFGDALEIAVLED